ncbi:hypothetical protein PENTCL1PPCAC_26509, partial [Pristionchus entomophagus]
FSLPSIFFTLLITFPCLFSLPSFFSSQQSIPLMNRRSEIFVRMRRIFEREKLRRAIVSVLPSRLQFSRSSVDAPAMLSTMTESRPVARQWERRRCSSISLSAHTTLLLRLSDQRQVSSVSLN